MKNRFFSILLLLCTLASLYVKALSDDHNYIVKSSFRSMERRFNCGLTKISKESGKSLFDGIKSKLVYIYF